MRHVGTRVVAAREDRWSSDLAVARESEESEDLSSETLERVKGIEPSSSVWKTEALPLSYTRGRPQRIARRGCLRKRIRHPKR